LDCCLAIVHKVHGKGKAAKTRFSFSIPRSIEFYKEHPKLVVLSITDLIADGILCNHTISYSKLQ
jgi:hypothetical protein